MLIVKQFKIQKIDFTGNLDRAGGSTMFFVIEGAKEQFKIFQKEHLMYYDFVLIKY